MTADARAGSQLASGVALLRPEEQVLTAMLEGWRNQQLARNLRFDTIESRQRMVQADGLLIGDLPDWAKPLIRYKGG